ncbi:MAG: class I SAM-dependent methyltransferase [Bacteroidota bacterium]
MPPPTPAATPPYDALAAGYDVVMAHVDYGDWADYVLDLFALHEHEPQSILELGCGTGSLAFELQERRPGGFRYLATDRSETMVRVARAKADLHGTSLGDPGSGPGQALRFAVADFTGFDVDERFDAVLLLYDGLNYLLDDADVAALFERVAAALAPGGLFIVDQSTPANSVNNEAYFEDEGEADRFTYTRHSQYDPATRLHTTTFDLEIDGTAYAERHVQRAYALGEIDALAAASPLEVMAAYDGFTTASATDDSERIHWIMKRSKDE